MKNVRHIVTMILTITCLVLVGLVMPPSLQAQEAIQATDQSWEAEFRDHLTFNLEAESAAEIVEAELLYRVVGQIATSRNEANFTPGTEIEATYEIDQVDPSTYFPPGTELQYWWKVTDAEGNELTTEKETLIYLDDRYAWQTLENERLTLYWYEGDEVFAQALFERANVALDTLENDVGVAIENPIRIFIYGNQEDLLGALRTSAQEWTGGVAFTEYGVVVIGIMPRQLEWGLNAMTHEMSHLIIHQATDNPFGDLPRWLDEGIAVYNENQDVLDDDFRPLFERAVENDELMTLRTLSSPFPADPMLANLAYGQSGAVVKYIIDTYGSDSMAELLTIFAEGELYDDALMQALGTDTDGLDNEFRASLDLPPLPGTEEVVEPEIEEAAVEAETSAEVNIEEPESSETVSEETEALAEIVEEAVEVAEAAEATELEEAEQAVAEPVPATTVAESAAEEPVAAEAESESASPFACLAGLLPLFAVGAVFAVRRRGWRFEPQG